MVRYKTQQLKADILLAPHHGSNTSSTSEFIDSVNPDYVIISAGRMNRFSHPHKKVIRRYQEKGCDIYNTAKNGQVSWLLERHGPLKPPVTRLNKHVYS